MRIPGGGAPVLQTAAVTTSGYGSTPVATFPANPFCMTFTTVCGLNAIFSGADGPCGGVANGTAVRVYTDYNTFVDKLSFAPVRPSTARAIINLTSLHLPSIDFSTAVSPSSPLRSTMSNVSAAPLQALFFLHFDRHTNSFPPFPLLAAYHVHYLVVQ